MSSNFREKIEMRMSRDPPPPRFHPGHLEGKVFEGGHVGGGGGDVGNGDSSDVGGGVGGGVDGEIGGGRAIP